MEDKIHQLDKELALMQNNVDRIDRHLIELVVKLDNLPEKLSQNLDKLVDDKLKIFQASHCVICKQDASEVKQGKFHEWIIRGLIGIISGVITAVTIWLQSGGHTP